MKTKAEEVLNLMEGKAEFSVTYYDSADKQLSGGFSGPLPTLKATIKEAEKQLPVGAVKVRIGKSKSMKSQGGYRSGVDVQLGIYKVDGGKLVKE